MRKIILSAFVLTSFGLSAFAGNGTTSHKGTTTTKPALIHNWTVDPFDFREFIENQGQFNNDVPTKDAILFQVHFGLTDAYFTDHSVIYKYTERIVSGDPDEKDPDEKPMPVFKYHYLTAKWEGANPKVTVTAEEELSNYYTYPEPRLKTIRANAFKKLVYHNIYPGIDVEYSFVSGKQGFKYALIVHPGADLSKVKLAYDGARNLSIDNGNLLVDSKEVGVLTDHAPISFYKEDNQPVESTFKVNGLNETFSAPVSASKTLVIDPWVTDPLLSASYDRAYDLDYDTNGNVYAYGGYSPYELSKINSVGTLLWTFQATIYNSPGYYGDMACDRPAGTCYLVEGFNSSPGARVIKINTNGNIVDTFAGDPTMREMWRACANVCNRTIVIGGGGTNSPAPYNAFILDTNCNKISAVNTSGATNPGHDVVLEALDPNGQYCYMAVPQSTFGNTPPSNEIIKSPLPSLSPNSYVIAPDSFGFNEVGQPYYLVPSFPLANGMNGMAVSPNYLYAYNGDTLRQFNKSSGALRRRMRVSTANKRYWWGGLDADVLDRSYVGYEDSIIVYDSLFAQVPGGVRMRDTVFDVVIQPPSKAYACGIGFVSAFTIPHIKLISTTAGSPTSCSACDGKASVTNMLGGLPPFTYLWSNGETGSTDTLLCAGLYTVTVTDASCPPLVDTAIITVSGSPGFSANLVDTNPSGCRSALGSITSFVTGGTGPYTYTWSNGQTTSKDTALLAGTYTLTVTDANGCTFVTLTALVNPIPAQVQLFPNKDSVCLGSGVNVTASGVQTYSWSPSAGLSCNNCPNPTASPTVNTTYTVTGTDSNGCTSTATIQISVHAPPTVSISPPLDTICQGSSVNLSGNGAVTYSWSPASSLSCNNCGNPSATPTVTTTYTLIGSNQYGCTDTATIQVVVNPKPNATITVVPSSDTICLGDSVLLIGGGGGSYLWTNHGSTKDSIWVKETVTTTEALQVTVAGCSAGVTKRIVVINPVNSTIRLVKDSICPADSTLIIASGGTTYKWLPPLTSANDSVWVKPGSNKTYSVVVSSRCGSDTLKQLVHVMPVPIIRFSGNTVICRGSSTPWTASGGTNYTWTPNSGLSCNNCPNPTASPTVTTTYTLQVSNGRCISDTTIKMTVATKPVSFITQNPTGCICKGSCATLTASGGGSYLWLGGSNQVDSVITICPTKDSIYSVQVDKVCKDTAKLPVCIDAPSFIVCCDTTIQIDGSAALSVFNYPSGNITWSWAPATGLSCTTCPNPVATPTTTTTYTVTFCDTAGCCTSRVVTVEIACDDFTMPNIFTPNNDGINDDFVPYYYYNGVMYNGIANLSSYSIKIYDRWGVLVYSSTDPKVYWNGRINGTDNLVPDGTYYYVIDASCQNNTYKKKGFVQVMGTK